jgi:CRP/FNR family cyclic AMP-dependent transcriptional regulator
LLQANSTHPLTNVRTGATTDCSRVFNRTCRARTQLGHADQPLFNSKTAVRPTDTHACRTHEYLARVQQVEESDPLYLFACHIEWELREEPSAAWELLSASESTNQDTRAHARALLASSRHFACTARSTPAKISKSRKRADSGDNEMKAPYDLEIVDDCTQCTHISPSHFCAVSQPALRSLDAISHKSTVPAGAILFVEGQAPRGLFVVCSGRVNLSTTSQEGKILILKTVVAGETLGLSATISGMPYEVTAETATPCQLGFVERKHFTELMEAHSEVGVNSAHSLSREYQNAYRDIHHLVLTRSSKGKLARLLLSQAPSNGDEDETRIPLPMTHEEIAQRIGASRETVTRLLGYLRRKHLIRLDGPNLVIRNRSGLKALTI